MTGMRRPLGLVALVTALASTPAAASWTPASSLAAVSLTATAPPASVAQDRAQTLFEEAVGLLRRGRDEEALARFRQVLALDLDSEAAYRLWQATEHQVWLDMLVKQGEFAQIAEHLMGRVREARVERADDGDTIRRLLTEMFEADVVRRRAIVRELASNHGEFAVPFLLGALGDPAADERRVLAMTALTEMAPAVVPALIEALHAPDAFLRRNVATTLGFTADGRARGMLTFLRREDSDEGVRMAAAAALARVGYGEGTPAQLLVEEGRAYLARDERVLAPHHWSPVVWTHDGARLVHRSVPRLVYAEEMAKQSFYRALLADPASPDALAGLARASVLAERKLLEAGAAGHDLGDFADQAAAGSLAALAAGASAMDQALVASLARPVDEVAAVGLCRLLGRSARHETSGLRAALALEGHARIAEEAAIALAHIRLSAGGEIAPAAIERLGRATGRQVLRLALVIDPDRTRAETLVSALRGRGFQVMHTDTGALGLGYLRRLPGLDAVFVAERLPDLTAFQVLTELENDPVHGEVPRHVLAADADEAEALFGARATVLGADLDLDGLEDTLEGRGSRDRDLADDLAARAAEALAGLAAAGVDVSGAALHLVGTLTGRQDRIALASLAALQYAARPGHADALVAVMADAGRSIEVRRAAGRAMAGLCARAPQGLDAGSLAALVSMVAEEDDLELRAELARALGSLDLEAGLRAEVLRSVRVNLGARN